MKAAIGFPVYPRWRGEHGLGSTPLSLARGLSPLARGTPDSLTRRTRARRFIPAGAGNTSNRPHRSNRYSVYPRWRGEHNGAFHCSAGDSGLSPLARGTRAELRGVLVCRRFIPAGAGNTNPSTRVTLSRSVYPRWRGEHTEYPMIWTDRTGLSPLARGTLDKTDRGGDYERFIPAGAGNT